MNTNAMSIWTSSWDSSVHETEYAAKRIKSAKSAKLTPVRINVEDMYGHFQGSHGRYETFLDTCPCGDFHRSHLPCKHIYRLAMELGIFDNSGMQTDSLCIVTPKKDAILETSLEELINILESGGLSVIEAYANNKFIRGTRFAVDTSIPDHKFLLDNNFWDICEDTTSVFFNNLNRKSIIDTLTSNTIIPPNGLNVSALKEWILCNYESELPNLFPNILECTFSRKYDVYHNKLYQYCHRVVSPYSYLLNRSVLIDSNGNATYDIPNDEINLLYYKNGHTFDLDIHNNPFYYD